MRSLDIQDCLEKIGEKLAFSQVDENNKIDPKGAVFHTITRISETVSGVMGETSRRQVGHILRNELWFGRNVLEQEHMRHILYAITREGARKIIQAIDLKNKPKKGKGCGDMCMPFSGNGSSVVGRTSQY